MGSPYHGSRYVFTGIKGKSKQMKNKFLIICVAFVQIFAMSLFASCNVNTPSTFCHATGDAANPYEQIAKENAKEHLTHTNDIYPVPVGGCPTSPLVIKNNKITICHATNSTTNPYYEPEISINGLDGHAAHANDLIPAPDAGCPASLPKAMDGKITICHSTGSTKNPYNEITVSMNGLDGHNKHGNDIIPVPEGGCN
jgi:hypothetical protein